MHARTGLVLLTTIAALACGCESAPASEDAGRRDASAVRDDGSVIGDGGSVVGDDGGSVVGDDGGIGGDGGGIAAGSDGCGEPLSIATAEWVARSIDVAGVARAFWVWLPEGYDADRAYPIVYQFHGCSDSATREDNNVPVQRESGADAIHIRGRAAASCWDTAADGVDFAYFDALVPEVEATWCADPARRFATGYSSGSFMVHRLACLRGDVLRGIASIAGGQGGGGCVDRVAALLIHDADDGTVNISASEGARDAHAARNECDTTAARSAVEPAPCEAYADCDPEHPVVWCRTTGRGHSRQDALAAPAFWGFLSSLSATR